MTVRIADARKIPQILVKDNKGNIVKVINVGDLQVGFEGAESTLILTGGVDMATRLVELQTTNPKCYIQEEDLVLCIYSPSSIATVYLPSNPDKGRLFAIKDVAGIAGTYNIVVTPPSGKLIDGATSKSLTSDYGSFFVMWTGEEWVTLGGSGGGGGISTPSTGANPSASYITVNSETTLAGERHATTDGSIVFTDGGANSTFQFALSNTGVTAGTYEYPTLTVDIQGRITNIFSNPIIWRLHTGVLNYATPGYYTQSFYYTGASQTWTIPNGVTQISVELWGAGGGGWDATDSFGGSYVSDGGGGGYTSASNIPVAAGDTITVRVGGRGKQGGELGGEGGSGGWPDGLPGAVMALPPGTQQKGGGGGGGTFVTILSSYNYTASLAAGGGGGGGSGLNSQGGNGGGTSPHNGYATVADSIAGAGGGGGSSAANGGGGGGGGYIQGNGGNSAAPNYNFAGGGGGGAGFVGFGNPTSTQAATQIQTARPDTVTGSRWYYTGSTNYYGAASSASPQAAYNQGLRVGIGSNQVVGGGYANGGDGMVVIEYYITANYSRSVAYTTSSVAIVSSESEIDQLMALDTHFYVTGTRNIQGISASYAVFGGDTKVSGSLEGLGGFTGSLQKLSDGRSYLVAGGGISISSGTNQVVISSQNSDVPFLTLTSATGLTNERVFSVSGTSGLKLTDNGPGNTAALTINDNVVATISGSRFSGNVVATSGLSGTLQRTSAGLSYLVAGANVTVTTQSNGQILIDAATSASINITVSGTWRDPGNTFVTTGSVSIDASNRTASTIGSDVFFFVSGSKSVTSGGSRKVSVFGGDTVISGTGNYLTGLSASLQNTTAGVSYLVAGANVTITTQSNGQVVIASTATGSVGGGGSGDPDATYVVMSLTSSLNNERRLAGGSNIFITDGGPGGDVTISTTSASSGSLTLAAYHDTTYSPVALYQFSGSLGDSSNNSLTALSVLSGTARYIDVSPGVKGLWLDGYTAIGHNSTETSLVLTGGLTLETLAIIGYSTNEQTLFGMLGPSADVNGNENYLYRYNVLHDGRMTYFAEQGNGTNISFTTSGSLPQGELVHLAMTRNTTGDVKFYVNGFLFEGSSGLTSPNTGSTGTSTARFRVGASDTGASFGLGYGALATKTALASLKVIASELSPNQVYQEFSRTIGSLYGINVTINASGTWNDRGNQYSTTSSVSIDTSNRNLSSIGSDVFFYVSGSKGVSSGINRKMSVFGGDTLTSGTAYFPIGLSGSLQCTTDGLPFIIAGSNVTISTTSNGQIAIAASGGPAGGGDTIWSDGTNRALATGSVSIDASGRYADQVGSDVFFFVSGSTVTGSKDPNKKVALFGGDVVVSGSVNSYQGNWTTLFDIDFTSLPSQHIQANGQYTIAGLPWQRGNSANGDIFLTNGTGLQIIPSATSDYNGATRTLPYLWLPLSSCLGNVPLDWTSRLRLYVSIGTDNPTAIYHNEVFGFDTNGTRFGLMIKRGYSNNAGIGTAYTWTVNNANATSGSGGFQNSVAYTLANYKTYCFDFLGDPLFSKIREYRSGTLAAGSPFVSRLGTYLPGLQSQLMMPLTGVSFNDYAQAYGNFTLPFGNDIGLLLGAQRAASATAFTGTFQRVRLDYRIE